MTIIQLLRQIIRETPLYYPLRNCLENRRQLRQFAEWERNGKPIPPPHIVKQRTLQLYARRYGLKVLVETGTYYGAMVEAMKNTFDHIYSIELSKELYEQASARFRALKHVVLIHGNSGVELGNIMAKLDGPALFWLDAHYSAGVTARGDNDTPIHQELNHILKSPDIGHVIIIDDARAFGKDPAYPRLEELIDFIRSRRTNIDIVVQDDSIRVTPKQ